MERTVEEIVGDTPGHVYTYSVYRFRGRGDGAPTAYLQAALHGGELPGTVALDRLMERLRQAEGEGRILGDITVVPTANPIARGQQLFGELQGRFHLGTRINFNRDFPLLARPDAALLPAPKLDATADQRLKRRLVELSMGHDIVLDLHCDDEGVPYLYVPKALWPAMEDCAAAMGAAAVVLWDGPGGGAFEEAAIHPYLQLPKDEAGLARRVVTTVELRGLRDVETAFADADAAGLYRLLAVRGVIADNGLAPVRAFRGVAAPIENIEMIGTPVAGAVLYDVLPGDRVEAGQRVATIVFAPGEPDGRLELFAPQAGFVLTRRATRALGRGADVLKLVGEARSADARGGVLED